ncbi:MULTISPECIES: DUF3247 family protein [Luteimonas]|uniref:DUF3247 family protein n=1 Tax=Luteimonas TaxID=83614 RepID=UPI000C7D734A|nr:MULTISPECIES: DUF3247 family protein [Luteimonas]
MSHTPPRILTSQADIARLQALIDRLDDDARVELLFEDGRRVSGSVSARPTIEAFRDAAGDEGHNALLRFAATDDADAPTDIWLDGVREVIHAGAV